jgi:hypothetical protein
VTLMSHEIKIGDRVFISGTMGRYGKVTTIIHSAIAPHTQYMVQLRGSKDGHSGPFVDVRKAA